VNIARTFKDGFARNAKKLLPEAVVREIQLYRAYGADERLLYVRVRLAHQFALGNTKLPQVPQSARSILFVCFGNIMRSPMCEALLNRELVFQGAQYRVMSAGLNATEGRPAHDWAVKAAGELGISLENHRAQLLTSEMVKRADAIFAMDYKNQVQLLSRWPDAKKKIFLLGAYASPGCRVGEIADPYYLGLEGTRRCYAILTTCVQNFARSQSIQNETISQADNSPGPY